MAKDRAKDPKRVPSLGISDPISHVQAVDASQFDLDTGVWGADPETRQARVKRSNDYTTASLERRHAGEYVKSEADFRNTMNSVDRRLGKTPNVVKINTDPAKGK